MIKQCGKGLLKDDDDKNEDDRRLYHDGSNSWI